MGLLVGGCAALFVVAGIWLVLLTQDNSEMSKQIEFHKNWRRSTDRDINALMKAKREDDAKLRDLLEHLGVEWVPDEVVKAHMRDKVSNAEG